MALRLMLASASPRRRDLLHDLQITVFTRATDILEHVAPDEPPREYSARIALAKMSAAFEVWQPCDPALILTADTVVGLGNQILGKPGSRERAIETLQALSGRTHSVYTSFALGRGPSRTVLRAQTVQTVVTFRSLAAREIEVYVATGEPLDKAGSYAIQGRANSFVTEIHGSYTNVVGLPLAEVAIALQSLAAADPSLLG
jgi:septum formation protein